MPRIHVYADESCTHGERYMLIGGLWIPATDEPNLRADIAQVRASTAMTAEFKWKKVSRTKLPAYQDFVSTFFQQCTASFHCIIVDVTTLDYGTFARGDAELGFYKFYFQLISRKLIPSVTAHPFVIASRPERSERSERSEGAAKQSLHSTSEIASGAQFTLSASEGPPRNDGLEARLSRYSGR